VDSITGNSPSGVVELQVPAEASYVSIVRLAATGLAARAQLTVDDIEDLRLAVDEACALVLPHARPGSTLDVSFQAQDGWLGATVSVSAAHGVQVDKTGFTWTVLTALVSTIEVRNHDDRLQIEITRRRLPARL
jgi:serine/threonine-protein kinase RsbW